MIGGRRGFPGTAAVTVPVGGHGDGLAVSPGRS
jgi:hypothetical protein